MLVRIFAVMLLDLETVRPLTLPNEPHALLLLSELAEAPSSTVAPLLKLERHDGYYCPDCSHHALGEYCASCHSHDVDDRGDVVVAAGAPCGHCGLRLLSGAWLLNGHAHSGVCFGCAIDAVFDDAPGCTRMQAVNHVLAAGGEPSLKQVLTALGYRANVIAFGISVWRANIVTTFGDVVLEHATALRVWAWLHEQGLEAVCA